MNEAKFGVRTDYAEELYTTELDPRWVLPLPLLLLLPQPLLLRRHPLLR